MKIGLIGTGYVGTVAGACFAEAGNSVICVDKDPRKVEALSKGDPVIFEPGLEALLARGLRAGTIRFTTSVAEAVRSSDILFMTVGTPPLENGEADLSFLRDAAIELGRAMNEAKQPRIIVNKSTVPVGTHRKVAAWIRSQTEIPFEVVSNPEFLREGAAIEDFLRPERVVIGTDSDKAFRRMKKLYAPFVKDPETILRMNPMSAELCKYACNAFLATRISFMNELAQLCDATGGDVEAIRRGMALDSRIGPYFLKPGIGYGGSCFPKDIRALIATAQSRKIDLRIVRSAEEANEKQKKHLLKAILRRYGRDLSSRVFAIWGLAFKPETDDIREAPALVLIRELLALGAKLRVHDPVAMPNARALLGDAVVYCDEMYAAADGTSGLILATEWKDFGRADLLKLKRLMKEPAIFDGRNAIAPEEAIESGFLYQGIGRGHLSGPADEGHELPVDLFGIAPERLSA
jgi:UDPglucose 6-dehydrogenase